MRDELLAYLLNDLDGEQRTRIEARLEADPIWQLELERLRSYVDEACEQSDTDALPEDLVSRTCSFVQQASSQGELSPAVLPATLSESQDAAEPRHKRWTLLDMAVVASILAVLGTLLVPAIRESREAARRQQCQANLHTLGTALARFAQQHDNHLPAIGRHETAGMFAIKLLESGVISPEELAQSLQCPSVMLAENQRLPSRLELNSSTTAKLAQLLQQSGNSFAYRIGYMDEQGNYRQIQYTRNQREPMMADKPSYDVVGFQSENHKGCGKNVLFQDQSVRYVQLCIPNGPDQHWFLNLEKQPAAGIGKADIVMIRSEASPAGPLLPVAPPLGTQR